MATTERLRIDYSRRLGGGGVEIGRTHQQLPHGLIIHFLEGAQAASLTLSGGDELQLATPEDVQQFLNSGGNDILDSGSVVLHTRTPELPFSITDSAILYVTSRTAFLGVGGNVGEDTRKQLVAAFQNAVPKPR